MTDHVISTYNSIAHEYASIFSEPTDYLDSFLDILPLNATILDIGCGPGIDVNYCHKRGFEVEGFDLSPTMVSLAQKKNPQCVISLADITDFKSIKSYDACIVSYSLIHIPKIDIPRVLSNIRACLKNTGYLYVSIHEGESCEKLLDEPLNPSLKIFLNIFTEEELSSLLVQSGFQIVETRRKSSSSPEEFLFNKLIIMAKTV